jgi:hypothetical protein
MNSIVVTKKFHPGMPAIASGAPCREGNRKRKNEQVGKMQQGLRSQQLRYNRSPSEINYYNIYLRQYITVTPMDTRVAFDTLKPKPAGASPPECNNRDDHEQFDNVNPPAGVFFAEPLHQSLLLMVISEKCAPHRRTACLAPPWSTN